MTVSVFRILYLIIMSTIDKKQKKSMRNCFGTSVLDSGENHQFCQTSLRHNSLQHPQYFWMGIFASSIWSPTAICECKISTPLIWRDLVDAVAHAYRRLLVGLALQKGFPTTWKGDGRAESRQLQVSLGTVQVFHSVESVSRVLAY